MFSKVVLFACFEFINFQLDCSRVKLDRYDFQAHTDVYEIFKPVPMAAL